MPRASRGAAATEDLRRSLVDHAKAIVRERGPAALTIRALADEADCSVGLLYKVFADRGDLVVQIVLSELEQIAARHPELVERAGTGTVGGNLTWYATSLLRSPSVALARDIMEDPATTEAFTGIIDRHGGGLDFFEGPVAEYLAAEQALGRVRDDVDVAAFAFLIAGAVHNLIVAGDAYPRPSTRRLRRHLDGIAATIAAGG